MDNRYVKDAEQFLLKCTFYGLAHSYCTVSGKWVKPYPEVTGYLIDYFCKYATQIPHNIIYAANKLISLQDPNTGGWPSFDSPETLYAFDTAQILLGMISLYKRTKKKKYLNAALLGGSFLDRMTLNNGVVIPQYNKYKRTRIINRDTYSIWGGVWSPLMCKLTEAYYALYEVTMDRKYMFLGDIVANHYEESNYTWHTHPLGYYLEGLYAAEKHERINEVLKSNVIPRICDNGYISYAEKDSFSYVSGVIQLGIILYKEGYKDEAILIRNYARSVQDCVKSQLSDASIGFGLYQYADYNGNVDHSIHAEINSWGTKYFCQLERMLDEKE